MSELLIVGAFCAGLLAGLAFTGHVLRRWKRDLRRIHAAVEKDRRAAFETNLQWADRAMGSELKARVWFAAYEELRQRNRRDDPQFDPEDPDWWKR